jgi:hypothetical protein
VPIFGMISPARNSIYDTHPMEAPSEAELRRAGKALALGFALGLVLLLVARRAGRADPG